jgi:hypothetical protein
MTLENISDAMFWAAVAYGVAVITVAAVVIILVPVPNNPKVMSEDKPRDSA